MIVTTIFGIITLALFVVAIIAFLTWDEDIAIGLFFVTLAFVVITGIAGGIETFFSEEITACQTYCQEEGYSYDSVKTEGEEQYCVCDTGLKRHLITKTNEVIIE